MTPTARHARPHDRTRAPVGLAPPWWEARLATAARLHSEDMALHAYFSHTSLDGRSPWDRIRA